jgi:uncharacterized protein YkwD
VPFTLCSRRRMLHLAAAVIAGVAGAHRGLPVAAIDAANYCPSAEERAFLKRIIEFRSVTGVGPLRLSRTLGAASLHHSQDMAAQRYFDHVNLDGDGPGAHAVAHGYPTSSVGENIAAGDSGWEATFAQWERSSGHRSNMLGTRYGAIGIGRAEGGPYR